MCDANQFLCVYSACSFLTKWLELPRCERKSQNKNENRCWESYRLSCRKRANRMCWRTIFSWFTALNLRNSVTMSDLAEKRPNPFGWILTNAIIIMHFSAPNVFSGTTHFFAFGFFLANE